MMEKKKDIRFLICQIVVVVVGLVYMLIGGRFRLILMYLALTALTVPCMFFNYSLCKWGNKWHSIWHERTPCDGEPSSFMLTMNKISLWTLFIIALIIPFLNV